MVTNSDVHGSLFQMNSTETGGNFIQYFDLRYWSSQCSTSLKYDCIYLYLNLTDFDSYAFSSRDQLDTCMQAPMRQTTKEAEGKPIKLYLPFSVSAAHTLSGTKLEEI